MAAGSWTDGWLFSSDNVRLHYRDWAGSPDRPALLCLPGLTRNAADFEPLAERLAGRWRIVAVDPRGRGESALARDSLTYVPLTYVRDIGLVVAHAGLQRFVVIGSGLGGQLALLLTLSQRDAMAGVILNDFGPTIEGAGLARLRANVGRGGPWQSWLQAARDLARRNAGVYPDWQITDWIAFAKRLCRLMPSGRILLDHDPRIAEPFRLPGGEGASDLWLALDTLKATPVLALRGALSDMLSHDTLARMQARLPTMTVAEVPRVGHSPRLDEPEAVQAIDGFLAQFEGGAKT